MNQRRVPEEEIQRFNKAQEALDYTTMYDILFHTACQYCKKRQGSHWDSVKIVDVANDIACLILSRYKKNSEYRCLHMAAVHYAFIKVIYEFYRKQDEQDKQEVDYDRISNYVNVGAVDILNQPVFDI